MSDEMRPIIGYCGHKVGTLGGPILVTVRCGECREYVGTYWADKPPPGYPALVATVLDDHGDEVDVWAREGAVLVTVNDDKGRTTAELSGERLAAFREAVDRAAMPGQVPALDPAKRPAAPDEPVSSTVNYDAIEHTRGGYIDVGADFGEVELGGRKLTLDRARELRTALDASIRHCEWWLAENHRMGD